MTTLTREQLRTDRHWQLTVAAVLGGVLLAYAGFGGMGGLIDIGKQWTKADYSHGFLVVPFALYLLWRNRGQMSEKVAWPNWGGLPLLLGPLPLYLADADLNVAKEWVQGGCLIASLTGVLITFASPPPTRPRGPIDVLAASLCLAPVLYFNYFVVALIFFPLNQSPMVLVVAVGLVTVGAAIMVFRRWSVLRWAVPALAMLMLALPLPYKVEGWVSLELRKVATQAGEKVFQTLGFPTRMDGPFILEVGREKLDVQEACSGLSMLLAFVALTAAIAFLCPPTRRMADRWAVVLSSIPIAVFCNIVRIVVSGLVLTAGWRAAFDFIVHDYTGYAMVLLALGLVWLEFKAIDWLLVPVVRMSREEVVKAGLAEARAEIERQEAAKRALQAGEVGRDPNPHPAAPYLPLTPAGTSHGATATGGTISPRPDPGSPSARPGPGAAP